VSSAKPPRILVGIFTSSRCCQPRGTTCALQDDRRLAFRCDDERCPLEAEQVPRRQSVVRAKAEGEATLHADTGTTDVVVEAGAELSCVFGFGMGASSEECYHCGAMAMQALVVGMGKEACGFKRKAGGMCVCDGRWGRNKRGAIGPTAEGVGQAVSLVLLPAPAASQGPSLGRRPSPHVRG
jgi:hypothetical protein